MITRRSLLKAIAVAPFVAASPTPRAIVAVGDSLTQRPYSYAHVVAASLELPITNTAIGGSLLRDQASTWFAAGDGLTLTIAGYNDARVDGLSEATGAAWRGLLTGLAYWRSRYGCVYIGTPLYMTAEGYAAYNGKASDATIAAYGAMVHEVARVVPGVRAVDLSGVYDPYRDVGEDHIHPTEDGHRRIAQAFLRAINTTYLPMLETPSD